MTIELFHRHYGVHHRIKAIEIPLEFESVYHGEEDVDEDALLDNMPDGWLPVEPHEILLMVADGNCATGISNLVRFRPWAKYFDSYSLVIKK